MSHITIRLASPPAGSKSVREIIKIKTPERMFSHRDSVLVEAEEKTLDMNDSCCESQVANCSSQDQPALDDFHANAEENCVYTNVNAAERDDWHGFQASRKSAGDLGDKNEGDKTVALKNGEKSALLDSKSQTQCDNCGRPVERDEFESELYITRKDLAAVQSQLESFKSRLEEELIERFKLDEELKTEAETHENEMKILKEKIESLEKNECEKERRIGELESMILVYKEEYEKSCEQMEDLRNFVGKYQTEVGKLRAEANIANEQAVEAINEMEILTKKTDKSQLEKEKIRKQLKSEMEGYWREVRELRNALENWEKLDSERKNRIQTLESEVASYKDLVNGLRDELTECNKTKGDNFKEDHANKNEHLSVLCHELNEIFREHLDSQGKFSELSFLLAATQKELEEVRNRSQMQNFSLQEFKQKYNDLHDSIVALNEENRHLRNSMEKKSADFRDIRRKFLVSETEVSWLKEALNIVDNAKKKSVCSDVMETVS